MSGQNILPILKNHKSFKHIESLFERFHQKGFEIYFAGGCVRDALLNRPIHDFDFATSAKPSEVQMLFPEATLDHGVDFGTVTVMINGLAFEVTTYRAEMNYLDHRRPKSVSFSASLSEDSARRDFTINALYANHQGQIIDPQNGLKDLENKILMCVGGQSLEGAKERFSEDALRMYRALRFLAQLNFSLEPNTFKALCLNWDLTAHLSKERRYQEFKKCVQSSNFSKALSVMLNHSLLPIRHQFSPKQQDALLAHSFKPWSAPTKLPLFIIEWGRQKCESQNQFYEFFNTLNEKLSFTKDEKRKIENVAGCLWAPVRNAEALFIKLIKDMPLSDLKLYFQNAAAPKLISENGVELNSRLESILQMHDQIPVPIVKAQDLNLSGAKLGQALARTFEIQVGGGPSQTKEQILQIYNHKDQA